MSKQSKAAEEQIIKYRMILLDIEYAIIRIETINKLLISYASEYSPEALIIAELLSKELKAVNTLFNNTK